MAQEVNGDRNIVIGSIINGDGTINIISGNPLSEKEFDVKSYREKLVTEHSKWLKRFVHLNGKQGFEEIPLFAEEADWGFEINESKITEKRQGTIENLRNELIKENCYKMVITGEAGMGKSTTLKYLALKDALDQNKNIPIYIELKLLVSGLSIEDYILKEYGNYGIKKDYLLQLFEEGRVNLYFDGLNEIAASFKISIYNDIKNIIKKYTKVFVLISTRKRDYINDFGKAPMFILQKMNASQIKKFIFENTETEDVRNFALLKIDNNNDWETLLGTPLILFMFLKLAKRSLSTKEEFPNDESKMIIKFIKHLYIWEKENDIGFDSTEFHLIISHFAFRSIQVKGNTNSGMKFGEINHILKEYDAKFSIKDINSFLNKAEELNLIVKDGGDIFSFAHQTYQETLAGDQINRTSTDIPVSYFSDSRYFELIKRATGLLEGEERNKRLEVIAANNIVLSAICKMTCYDEEEYISDFIIDIAIKNINNGVNIGMAFLALLEMQEYLIVSDLLTQKYHILIPDKTLILHILKNEDYFKVLRILSGNTPKSLLKEIFDAIKYNNINVDVEYYNSLLRIADQQDIWQIFDEMEVLGIVPNLITLELICSTNNFDRLKDIYDRIVKNNKEGKDILPKVYLRKLISLSSDYITALSYFKEILALHEYDIDNNNYLETILSAHSKEKIKSKKREKLILASTAHLIKLSDSESLALHWYNISLLINRNRLSFPNFFQYCKKINSEEKLVLLLLENIDYFKNIEKNKSVEHYDALFFYVVKYIRTDELKFEILSNLVKLDYPIQVETILYVLSTSKHQKTIDLCMSIVSNEANKDVEINSKFLTTIINNINFENSIKLFQKSVDKENIILYNVLIKRSPSFEDGKKILDMLLEKNLAPDVFSLAPLLKKVSDPASLFQLCSICSKYNIDPDQTMIENINNTINGDILFFRAYYKDNLQHLYYNLSKSWITTLEKTQISTSMPDIFECEIIHITRDRVYVKIKEEQRKCSIGIHDLSFDKINNIRTFKYKGVKLHIGRIIKAKLINIDRIHGLNLSLKDVNGT